MPRAVLYLAGLFLALLALASPVDAQLWSLCNSPTMSYCMSLMSYDYVQFEVEEPIWALPGSMGSASWTATIRLFGSGYESTGGLFGVSGFAFLPDGCRFAYTGEALYDGSAEYTLGDSGHCRYEPTGGPTIDGLFSVRFAEDISYSLSCNARDGAWIQHEAPTFTPSNTPCYDVPDQALVAENTVSVPEPSSLLLLATGLLGVGWSRRRH